MTGPPDWKSAIRYLGATLGVRVTCIRPVQLLLNAASGKLLAGPIDCHQWWLKPPSKPAEADMVALALGAIGRIGRSTEITIQAMLESYPVATKGIGVPVGWETAGESI